MFPDGRPRLGQMKHYYVKGASQIYVNVSGACT
jgi:hypothetical protein